MIAPRRVWQLRPPASIASRFLAAADRGVTAVTSDEWLVAEAEYNLLDSGWGLRCCRAFEARGGSIGRARRVWRALGWRIES